MNAAWEQIPGCIFVDKPKVPENERLANQEHVKLASSGPDALDSWREKNPDVRLDLEGADLSGVNLAGTKIRDANLQGTDFRSDWHATRGLEPYNVKRAENWKLAYYDGVFLPELGLPPDHNETLPQKLEELSEQAKAAGKE